MAKYALVIANNQYSDPGLAQLRAPGQDAEDFARVLRSKDIGAFEDVKVLLNQPEPVVREAIDGFFYQKKPDDLLLLYFSGHGVRDEQGALYLAVTNTNRARLRSTGIKSDFIRESMDQSRSRRQVLILDCCNSGAFAQGTKAALGASIGTSTAFEGTGYGRVVLTATDSTQFAWEGDKVIGESQTQNSLFTYFLVKGLEGEADQDGDGKITVDELYDYTYEQIVNRTPAQTPGKWSYKQQGEIVLRQTPVQEIKPAALPGDLVTALESTYPSFREAAVRQLDELMKSKNVALAISARAELERVAASDDSRRVALLAAQLLEPYRRAEREAAEKAAPPALDGPSVPDASMLSTNVYNAGGHDTKLDTSSVDIARSIDANVDAQPGKTDKTRISDRADRAPTLTPKVEITPSGSLIGWVSTFWIALTWSICFSIGNSVANAANSELGLGYVAGDWIGGALGGALGGLGTALILRRKAALKDWKRLLIVSLGFAIGVGIIFVLGETIGNEGGDTPAFVKAFALSGAVGGALGGLVLGLYLWMEHVVSSWKSALWISAGHALGFGLGVIILVLLYESMVDMTTISPFLSGAVRGAITGAIAGLIAGASIIFWIREERR